MRRALLIVVSTLVVLIMAACADSTASTEEINQVRDGVNATTAAYDLPFVQIDLTDGSSLFVSLDDRYWEVEFDDAPCVDALATSLCAAPIPGSKG